MNGPGYRTLLMHSYILLWHVRNALQRKLVHSQQQVQKLQWSHQHSVAMKTLWMELLHTQEADNCYSQNISYGFFQFLDLSLEVQTATKNQTQTQVMSVGVQPIKWYTFIDTYWTVCCLILHSFCRPTLTLMFCVQYAGEELSFSHTVPLYVHYVAKAHNPFQHDLVYTTCAD